MAQKSSAAPTQRQKGKRRAVAHKQALKPSLFRRWLASQRQRLLDLRQRRPHHSFVRTRRRDYRRELALPGYLAFTAEVGHTLIKHKKLFGVLVVVFGGLMILFGGLSSAQTYSQIGDMVDSQNNTLSGIAQLGLLAAAASTSLPATEVGQLLAAFLVLMVWLTTVWLLRELQAGRLPRLRDGLYNAGAPIMATILVALLLAVQLLPLGMLALAYTALSGLGLISQGLGAFLFSAIAILVITLTLYWLTTTLFALVIVTLPGMYPWQAVRAASDIVVGRRLRILLRCVWLAVTIFILWALVLIPLVFIDQQLSQRFGWYGLIPVVPVLAVGLSTLTTVWVSSYIYLLYRRVVADDSV